MAVISRQIAKIRGLHPVRGSYYLKMRIRLFIILFLAFMLPGSIHFLQEDSVMLDLHAQTLAQSSIPPIDQRAPAHTQTATFAMG